MATTKLTVTLDPAENSAPVSTRPSIPACMTRRGLSLLLSALAACASPGTPSDRDRLVATVPPEADVWWFTASPGGGGWAWSERRGADTFLHVRDRVYGPYS